MTTTPREMAVKRKEHLSLGRRERQIMESLYRHGRATVHQVLDDLADAPSYSAVRAMLAKLQAKGLVGRKADGPRFVYFPTARPEKAQASVLRGVVAGFFGGSVQRAVAALIDLSDESITESELDSLSRLIEEKKRAAP